MAKRKTPPAPTAGYVLGLYQARKTESDEARLRSLVPVFRQLVRMQHDVAIPEQYKATARVVKTPFIRDMWFRIVQALTKDTPSIHLEGADKTKESRAAADVAERWDVAALSALDDLSNTSGVYESMKALVRDMESVIKVVVDTDAWANFPARDRDENGDYTEPAEAYLKRAETHRETRSLPFRWRVVDRLSMLFEDGEFGDSWALEWGEYSRPYLARDYEMTIAGAGDEQRLVNPRTRLGGRPAPEGYLRSGNAGYAVKVEYWDQHWWHVVIDGADAPGFPKPNPYAPRLPYFRAKPDDEAESILYALAFLVPRLDEALTMLLNWTALGAFPIPVLKKSPTALAGGDPLGGLLTSGADGQPSRITFKPGKFMDLTGTPGVDMTFLVPPPIGGDLNNLIANLYRLIDIGGISSTFRGVGGADQAGYAIAQLIQAALLLVRRQGQAGSRQIRSVLEFMHWCIANVIKEPVYVSAMGKGSRERLCLKPTGAVGHNSAPVDKLAEITVRFKPTLPTDEQARAMIAQQLSTPRGDQPPLVSRRYAREEWLQIEDSEGMETETITEMVLSRPPLSDLMVEEALREAGLSGGQKQNPAAGLLDQYGNPLIPQAPSPATGVPFVPGLNAPLTPPVPNANPAILPGGGRPAGSYPGRPGNQGPNPFEGA